MSVIGYEKSEVVMMLAATWNRGSIGSSDAMEHFEYLATFGSALLKANAMAYSTTYTDEPFNFETITGREIKAACVCQSFENKQRGMCVLQGIRYSLIANNGTDFADDEILDGLLSLAMGQLRKTALHKGVKPFHD